MNGYLLDTNVISEFSRKKPDERLRNWVDSQDEGGLYLSVLTYGEIRKGITLLPESKKRTQLEEWLETELPARFKDRLLPITGKDCRDLGLNGGKGSNGGHYLGRY